MMPCRPCRLVSRARRSSRKCFQIVLRRLIAAFVPADAPVVLGGDETLERRQGAKIAKPGIYRDAARSSRSFVVNERKKERKPAVCAGSA